MTNEQAANILQRDLDEIASFVEVMELSADHPLSLKADAEEKAVMLLRATPDLRPMTLEEAVAYGSGPVYLENRKWPEVSDWDIVRMVGQDYFEFVGGSNPFEEYGKSYRLWKTLAVPTPEQSAAWKWEEEG